MKPSPILSQGPKQTWTSLTMRSRRLRSMTSSSTRFWPCRGLSERPMCEHGGGVAGVLNDGAVSCVLWLVIRRARRECVVAWSEWSRVCVIVWHGLPDYPKN